VHSPLSIHSSFAGRHILLTGASGFLGKVWLAMVLHRVPTVGKIYVLLRKKALRPALDRFEKMVANSPVFKPLHELHGAGMAEFIARRVEVIEGDVSLPNLGVDDPALAERLHRDLDLVLNCAGLVDFDPDLREAMSTNVDGARNAAEFTLRCHRAGLLHVSTCYVAGLKNGRIDESVDPCFSPHGRRFDVAAECAAVTTAIDQLLSAHESPDAEAKALELALQQIRDKRQDEGNQMLVRNVLRRVKRQRLKDDMVAEGQRRAQDWGWPNIYTYTKFMAEAIVAQTLPPERRTIFRPAIVESSLEYPFPGWNQGFNTSGPLIYLLGGWFRHLPARAGNAFDVIPVDHVCRALTIAGGALMLGRHAPVYQCGSSDRNLLTIDRAIELTALAHRKHLRVKGDSVVERVVLSRWDGVRCEIDHLMSVENLRDVATSVGEWLRETRFPKFLRRRAAELADRTDDALDALDTIQKVVDLYLPFVHDNHFIFASQALHAAPIVEPEFRCDPRDIDWRRYWLDIHVPGLRKWCFPLFDNKTPEGYTPKHPFKLPRPEAAPAPEPRKEPFSPHPDLLRPQVAASHAEVV
jgi:long-chain acyl-CoA synthetase